MAKRLLDRQVSLLDYLTSGGAIFGGKDDAPLDQALQGIDRALLRLEAGFSHEKRMNKIVAVFPRTFEILGANRDPIVRSFVEACPPTDISRLVNARQFHDFLSACWQRRPPDPRYLPDVAACELACAEVRVDTEESGVKAVSSMRSAPRHWIRRCRGVALVHCAYDVRPIFEEAAGEVAPTARDTPIAVAMPSGADQPRIFELLPVVFDLLAALDDWADPTVFCDTPQANELIVDLAEHGLLEVRR